MYSRDLKSGLIRFLMVEKRLGFKWSRYRMVSKIRKPNRLKSGQKCPDFEFTRFQMVGTTAKAIAKA